jgi:formyl-CoA transferase
MPESPIDTKLAAEAALPLAGVRVLDLTLARAGPTCVRHLADWGAEVIRVEPPANGDGFGGDRDGYDFQNLHRNKRSIALNLKSPEGKAALMKLAANADVLVENMRVKVKHRLGIAYDDLKGINPRLIYASISGFGQTGPYGERAGVDQIAQGMGGMMTITGEPGRGPMRAGIPFVDLTAGNAGPASGALADGWGNPWPGRQ